MTAPVRGLVFVRNRMKRSLLLLTLFAAVSPLPAQNLYFDTNGIAPGTSLSFSGTDSQGTYWNTDPTGGGAGAFSSWAIGPNPATMIFSAGSNGTSGQTLFFGDSVETHGVIVDEGLVVVRAVTTGAQSFSIGAGGITVNGTGFFRPSATFGQGSVNQGIILTASQTFTNNSSVSDGGIIAIDVINQAGQNVTLTVEGTGKQTILGNSNGIIANASTGTLSLVVDADSDVRFQALNTYLGSTTLMGTSGTYVVDNGGSASGTAGNPTNGAFGRGVVTLASGTVQMRSRTGVNNHFYNSTVLDADLKVVSSGSNTDGRLRVLGPVTITNASRRVNVEESLNPSTKALLEFGATVGDDGAGLGFAKEGLGTLLISGTTTYTGSTEIDAGEIQVTGRIGGDVNINSGGTLAGTGTVAGAVALGNGGTLAAGLDAIGTLHTGDLNTFGGGTIALEIDTTSVIADQVVVTGNLSLDNNNETVLALADLGGDEVLSLGTTFVLIDYSGVWNPAGLLTFNANVLADDAIFTFGANTYQISYNGVSGSDTAVTITTVVPEPATSLLAGLALTAVFLGWRRRRVAE
jgi:autotransporter-associated beta strand protein